MISVSTIVQRRVKILPSAFQHLFHAFNKKFNSFTDTDCILLMVLILIFRQILIMKRHIFAQMIFQTVIIQGINFLFDPTVRQKDELYIILLLTSIIDYHNFTSVSILFLTDLYLSFCRIFFPFLPQKLTIMCAFILL